MKYISTSIVMMSAMTLIGEKNIALPPYQDESESLFEEMMNDDWFSERGFFNDEAMMNIGSEHSHVWVQERAHEIEVCVALPKGVKLDDININVERDTLTIYVEYKQVQETKREGSVVKKQSMSSFNIVRTMPVPIDEQAVIATIENDVLKIILPKKTEQKKAIKIVQK